MFNSYMMKNLPAKYIFAGYESLLDIFPDTAA